MFVKRGFFIIVSYLTFYETVVIASQIHYKDCQTDKEVNAKIINVDITPCPKEPCTFHKRSGTMINGTITFIPKADVTSGKLEVYGILYPGMKVEFYFQENDPCQGHNLVCPVKDGAESQLKISLPLKPEYPSTKVIVQFDMRDQDNKMVFCIQFPAMIVD